MTENEQLDAIALELQRWNAGAQGDIDTLIEISRIIWDNGRDTGFPEDGE